MIKHAAAFAETRSSLNAVHRRSWRCLREPAETLVEDRCLLAQARSVQLDGLEQRRDDLRMPRSDVEPFTGILGEVVQERLVVNRSARRLPVRTLRDQMQLECPIPAIGRIIWSRQSAPRYAQMLQDLPPNVEADRVSWSRIDSPHPRAVKVGLFRQAEWRYRRGSEEFVLTWRDG